MALHLVDNKPLWHRIRLIEAPQGHYGINLSAPKRNIFTKQYMTNYGKYGYNINEILLIYPLKYIPVH